jgi:hypothetical protein
MKFPSYKIHKLQNFQVTSTTFPSSEISLQNCQVTKFLGSEIPTYEILKLEIPNLQNSEL